MNKHTKTKATAMAILITAIIFFIITGYYIGRAIYQGDDMVKTWLIGMTIYVGSALIFTILRSLYEMILDTLEWRQR